MSAQAIRSISAQFIKSSTAEKDCPIADKPEYAFIGRSNVGKSSLINMLSARNKLAKVSSRPGKTQLINHFLMDTNWYLVDLPGYGWAKVSKSDKTKWKALVEDYLLNRPTLVSVFALIDIRHEPQKIDLEFLNWMGTQGIPFVLVFTKADKLSRPKVDQHVNSYLRVLNEYWDELPAYFVTSSTSSMGREEILDFIKNLNQTVRG